MKKKAAPKPRYDCSKCPGYCCSYPVIPLTKRDVERLARHHDLSYEDAKAKFTKEAHGHKYTMRRKKDEIYGRICRFFDTTERRCTWPPRSRSSPACRGTAPAS